MKWAVIVQDIRFQWRHGFYAVYAIVSAVYAGILHGLPAGIREKAAQAIIYSDPVILGFLFAGGMVLLEKRQGVLEPLFARRSGSGTTCSAGPYPCLSCPPRPVCLSG